MSLGDGLLIGVAGSARWGRAGWAVAGGEGGDGDNVALFRSCAELCTRRGTGGLGGMGATCGGFGSGLLPMDDEYDRTLFDRSDLTIPGLRTAVWVVGTWLGPAEMTLFSVGDGICRSDLSLAGVSEGSRLKVCDKGVEGCEVFPRLRNDLLYLAGNEGTEGSSDEP